MVLLPCLWPVYSVVDDTSQAQLTRVAVHRLRTVILSQSRACTEESTGLPETKVSSSHISRSSRVLWHPLSLS